MFKKIITLLLAATLTYGLVACTGDEQTGGNNSSKDESSVSSNNSSETSSETSSDTSSDTSSETSSETSLDTSSKVSSTTSSKDNSLYTRRLVALTFDDSPYEDTGKLLDLLKEKDVKATFFMWGNRMEEHPEIVKRAIDEGHEIGWHTYDHTLHSPTKVEKVAADFDKAQAIMDKIYPGYKITLFRPVGGVVTDALKTEAAARDWRIINWTNYGFDDTKSYMSAEERMQGVYSSPYSKTVRNGEIFLIHPYKDVTEIRDGIGLLIDKLKTDGYEPVTMTYLLQRKKGGTAGAVYDSPIRQ